MKRNRPTRSEDPNSGASSSLTSPPVGDYEDGTKKMKGNDYEVFLCFRGKDTRKGFTDHLYKGLVKVGIHVFRDDNELSVGDEIGGELLRSIEQSKISIPIISEDYASSKWCLRELAHILKCKRNRGQIVLPIFYRVEPSKMRHLTGRLKDAINAHMDEMMEWEEALKEVTSLKGLESEKIDNGHEGTLVEIVVRKVMSELKEQFLLNVPKQLVGIDDHVEHIMSFIDANFSGTSMIGIYGMGGIGKTTLAKVLYNNLCNRYESRSFVADIRETSKVKGLECMQKQLIFNISGDSCDVFNIDYGISILKSRCTSKKVLIILDDVDNNNHLNALVEDGSWFKAGSIVIITTRDKSILDKAGVNHKYQLNELLLDQSLVLFSRHAFRKDSPPSDYKVISCNIVSTTGRLPLALEVIGSFLCGKTKEAWEATSKKLEKVPDEKVREKLKISYDALEFEDQQMFLDIACFFIGSSKQHLTYMWDVCDFFPNKGIEVLSLMSLIKITEDGKLMMHDQLRDLGREIVRLENPKKPQKRSRLWKYEDAADVLLNNKGTDKIEALCLGFDYGRESYTAETFKELTKLRLLQLEGVHLTGDFQNLFPQLRWLEWTNHQQDFELTNFHLKKLVVLNLSCSLTSEDWGGWSPLKMATELKVLNLSGCALRTTPDLSAFKSLEILILENCKGLEEIHPSIEDIKTIVSLNVSYCKKLKELPLGVGRMEELRELLIDNTNIQDIPISRGCLTKLETLNAKYCGLLAQLPKSWGSLISLTRLDLSNTGIEELPEPIGSLKKLETLNASYCASLTHITNSIGNLASLSHLDLIECQKLVQLPNSIGSLVSLLELLLSGCRSLRQIPDSIRKLTSLTELHLQFMAIEELPESIGSLKELKILDASYCASLARIPNSIGDLASLSHLNLTECQKLVQLPDSIGSLMSLLQLSLSRCHLLRQIPDSIGKLTSLTELHLNSTAIEELPESIGSLKKLKTLDASCCLSLGRIPNSIGDLASLSHLDLTECQKLVQLPDSIGSLMSLPRLLLSGCHLLRQIPYSIGKLTSLSELHLNSTAIEELPESIGYLKKLKTLDVSCCASLGHIPNSIGDLASLSHFLLEDCQKLVQLPDSIGSLVSLPQLLLMRCHSLRQIPHSIGKLTSLTKLDLYSTAIKELPECIGSLKKLKVLDIPHLLRQIPYSIGELTSLIELYLNSTAIEELPESIGSLKKLKILHVSNCVALACIPNSIGDLASLSCLNLKECQKVTQLPDSIGSLVSLSRLFMSKCYSLRQIPDLIGNLTLLTELHLNSTTIEELPESIGSLKKLNTLNASYCETLACIPNSIGDLASLSCLDLTGCQKLVELPDSIGSLVSLSRLLLSGCHSLRQIPHSIGKLTSLAKLHLGSTAIEELPESIGYLKKLKTLDASYCASLARIPNSIGDLASLSHLNLTKCQKLTQLPDSISSLVSLSRLLLSGCHSLRQIPDSIRKLISLTELHLKSTAIEELPKSIGNMQNLWMLDIGRTPIIKLPEGQGILAELQRLRALAWKNLEGPPSNNGQLVSPNNLDLDKHKKLSELHSCVLAPVLLNCLKTPPTNNSTMDYQTTDSEHVLKRSGPFGISYKVKILPINILPVTYNYKSLGLSSYSSNDLPRNVVSTLSQDSLVKSMDFHPMQQILLLVGTNMGNVMVWEVGSGVRIALRKFKVWDLETCSRALKASLANDHTAPVNCVMWSPDGSFFGVAYSKHMVHIYSHHGGGDIRNHLELEAHVGSVNDLAFSSPNKQLCVVTCGEDRLIKVWDVETGAKQHILEGHEAPVYSVFSHNRENIQFIFSTTTDGKIKAWLYDNMGSRVDCDAPGHALTKMACSADRSRLFSCGTNKEGESYLVEWNEKEGHVKRTYHGLGKRPGDFVQFDTAKNRFLVAGDEFMVKFWDMDNNNILTSTDADGGLPASPCIRFNKEGILLAVSTSDNSIKILANADGIRLLRTVDNQPSDASRITLGPLMKDSGSMANVKPRIANESGDDSRTWKLTEINEPLQCRSIRLPDNSPAARVSRLIYTESGLAILALSSNAAHKLWKWQQSDQNLTGRATTNVVPQLWQPPGGNLMTNDISDTNPEDAVPCFALSKNHARLVSASGGKISLFKMQNFQTMSTFMPQPPASTYLASYPQDNNIIAIGMEDPSIQIDSDQVDAVCKKLKGHQRIIKGFDFSTVITVVVFSGSDSQTMTTFVPARQAATFLAWLPQDNDIIAIGMEDSSIQIYNVQVDEFKAILRGHQKRITGLAFSSVLKVLVSSGADSQLCVWSADGWEKQASCFLQMPTRLGASPLADTRVQFNVDQIHLLVVHETHIATYEATKLECLQQWVTREASGPITDATYSCNGQSIYVSFEDGSIGVFAASTLRFTCRINPAAYIPPNPNLRVYPLAIAANPFEPNQFALGLTDGSVHIFEPLECEGEWGASPPVEDGVGPSTTSGTTSSDQPPLPMADEASLPQIWATRLRPRRQQPSPCDLGTATVKKERKKKRC